MRLKLTFLLLALNVGLYALIHWLNAGLGVSSPATRVFSPGLPQTAEVFEIRPPAGKPAWKLRRDSGGWRIEAPYKWDANLQTVTQMLDQLDKLTVETSFPLADIKTANPLADYGLAENYTLISLTPAGGTTSSIRLAQPNLNSKNIYLLDPTGTRVVVAKDAFVTTLDEGIRALRSPTIFNLDTGEIRILTLQERSNDKVRLERSGPDWKFVSPMSAPADQLALEGTLQKLVTAQSAAFYEPDLATQGLDTPDLRLVLEAANGRRQTLLIGHPVRAIAGQELKAPDYYYARLDDNNSSVFALGKEFVDPFRLAQKDFRQRRLLPTLGADKFAAAFSSLQIRRYGRTLTLTQLENGQWVLPDEPGRPAVDPVALRDLTDSLVKLEAMEFVNDAPTKEEREKTFGKPAAVITLTGKSPVKTPDAAPEKNPEKTAVKPADITLTLGERDGAVHAQVGEAASSIFRVPQAFLDNLSVHPLAYRQRVVEQIAKESDVIAIRIEPVDGGEPIFNETLDPTKEAWQNKFATRPAPWNEPAYLEAIMVVEAYARQFRVARYNGAPFKAGGFTPQLVSQDPTSSPYFGSIPWKWKLTYEVLLPGDSDRRRTFTYLLTDRIGESNYGAGSSAQDKTFFPTLEMVKALGLLTKTPTFPQPPAPEKPKEAEKLKPAPSLPGTNGKKTPPAPEAPFVLPPEPVKPAPF